VGTSLKQLAELTGGRLEGDGDIIIESAAPIETAGNGEITFVANDKYLKFLKTTAASAVVLHEKVETSLPNIIRHTNPYYAFALILDHLYPEIVSVPAGIDKSAVIDNSAVIGDNCTVGALSYIGRSSRLGKKVTVYPQVHIGNEVVIGDNCRLYPGVIINDNCTLSDNVTIHSGTVVGSDGFGYAQHDAGIKKVKQIGSVEIGYNVEIGANCTIDRGALGANRIGKHVKIDNLVQIAHNVEIGDYSIIVSQVGISGSTKLGKNVILAGQVGLVGHIELGDGVTVGAQSGVSKSVPAGKTLFGCPARDIMKTKRIEACLSKLPELFKRVKEIEDKKK
jgi:UDP-3-O-[3-hydroxymyristoyl] glucosamine N-acyltransferase